MKPFYLSTPLYYVNDKPHIGHAYTTLAADVLARWKRLQGAPVFFLTGTDEHGSKIAEAAEKHGCTPKEYADRVVANFQEAWTFLNISNDDFIRTTQERHRKVVQSVYEKLFKSGEIYKGSYEGWYCVADETFWLESQLKDKKCPECGRAVERLKEETYYFKLSKYGDRLLQHYKDNPEFLSPPHRAMEMVRFVEEGLKDLSISRLKETWGIPLPFDPQHTAYVWFDALLNYITAAGYGQDEAKMKDLWPADVHFVGKEIYRFHTVIWPAMLMALGLPLPKKVFAHGWWTVEGQKMSKSVGNVVDPIEVGKEFGVDGFRYFILREMPFGVDGDFSRKGMITRYNTELANDFGNLLSRTLTLIEKNFEGKLSKKPQGQFAELMKEQTERIEKAFDQIAFHEVLEALFKVVGEANRFVEQKAPWALVKTDRDATEQLLAEALCTLRWLAVGFHPFMPEITEKMWLQLGETSPLKDEAWKVFRDPMGTFKTGMQVRKEGVLFPRKQV
jgi:methionyl-tRNA synthetase